MGKKDRLCPNPVMAHKKKMKQKEIKRNKRHKVERQEAQELLRDPDALAAEIARVAEDATHSSEARAKLKALQAHQKVLAKSLAADAKRRPEELGFKGAPPRGAPRRRPARRPARPPPPPPRGAPPPHAFVGRGPPSPPVWKSSGAGDPRLAAIDRRTRLNFDSTQATAAARRAASSPAHRPLRAWAAPGACAGRRSSAAPPRGAPPLPPPASAVLPRRVPPAASAAAAARAPPAAVWKSNFRRPTPSTRRRRRVNQLDGEVPPWLPPARLLPASRRRTLSHDRRRIHARRRRRRGPGRTGPAAEGAQGAGPRGRRRGLGARSDLCAGEHPRCPAPASGAQAEATRERDDDVGAGADPRGARARAPRADAPADAAFSAFMDEMRELPEPGKS